MGPGIGGTVWRDRRAWEALRDGSACPCEEGKPKDAVAELKASWVTAPIEAPLPAYVCIWSKRHVVEPYELPEGERAAFWEDCAVAGRALAGLFRPIKINYEIHGNTIPHLHMHIFPRSPDDPFVGGPIDPRKASFTRTPKDLERIRRALEALHGRQ